MIYVNARAIIERDRDGVTEVLLQVRDRPPEPRCLELPGGRLEEFEPILDGLAREVLEETGLHVTEILDATNRTVAVSRLAEVECLTPFFVYQTTKGPVDSAGFYFRCHAQGELTANGDGAFGHQWVPVAELAARFEADAEAFDWLTQGALRFYLQWRNAIS